MTFRGHFFSKWGTFRGHFLGVTSRGRFLVTFRGHFCPRNVPQLDDFSWTLLGCILVDTVHFQDKSAQMKYREHWIDPNLIYRRLAMCQNLCVFSSFTRIKRPQPNFECNRFYPMKSYLQGPFIGDQPCAKIFVSFGHSPG